MEPKNHTFAGCACSGIDRDLGFKLVTTRPLRGKCPSHSDDVDQLRGTDDARVFTVFSEINNVVFYRSVSNHAPETSGIRVILVVHLMF